MLEGGSLGSVAAGPVAGYWFLPAFAGWQGRGALCSTESGPAPQTPHPSWVIRSPAESSAEGPHPKVAPAVIARGSWHQGFQMKRDDLFSDLF